MPSAAAVNVTLLAIAGDHRAAAAPLLLGAGWPAVQQSIDISCPPSPPQQTRCTLLQPAVVNSWDRQMDGHRTVTYTLPHFSVVTWIGVKGTTDHFDCFDTMNGEQVNITLIFSV